MKPDGETVVVVPCSGIGKTFGSVSREAAYDLCEDLRPESTRLVALARLVLGEPGARELVAKHPAVTIDGCKQMCASKMVRESGGTVAREVAVLDVFRRHKDLKPEGIAEQIESWPETGPRSGRGGGCEPRRQGSNRERGRPCLICWSERSGSSRAAARN